VTPAAKAEDAASGRHTWETCCLLELRQARIAA
jgi:hypothetical protein